MRTLGKTPGFAAAAILTLALGIGVNTSIFSVVYGILFRPLPYHDAGDLVLVEAERDVSGTQVPVRESFTWEDLELFRSRFPSFQSVAFYAVDEGVFSTGLGAEPIDFAIVSGSFFPTLRGAFELGRPLGPADDLTPAIVISERLWRRTFDGSTEVLGQRVVLNSRRGDGSQRAAWRQVPFTIVGVADSSVQFPSPHTDVWISAGFVRTFNPRCCAFAPVARLKSDATLADAGSEAAAVAQALSDTNPRAYAGLRAKAVSLHDSLVRTVRTSLLMLLTAVGLVLFIACANVMNLLVARGAARKREMAVRLALGASRGRLLRQYLVETGLLTTIGGAAGIALAAGIVETLRRLNPPELPRLDAIHLDAPVLLFACATAGVATVASGTLPALLADASEALHPGGRGSTSTLAGVRVRRALTIAELAASIVLLVGALLLGRSLVRLIHGDLGVDTNRVATLSMSLALDRELNSAQQIALVERVLERIRRLPGVESAGVGTSLPPRESRILLTLRGDNAVDYRAAAIPSTPGYFEALGIRLLKGRLFTEADDGNSQQVMIMSAETARHFFGAGDPLGRTLTLPVIRDGAAGRATMTLVGITGEVKYSGLERAADNAIYRPFAQQPWPHVFLVARTAGDADALAPTLRREIASTDRGITVSAVGTLDGIVSDAAAQPRFRTLLLAALATLSLSLAAIGLYGVVSWSVTQRTPEIGIRMALGATPADVMKMILGEGMRLAAGGVAAGIAGAYALARTMAALLYGIGPADAVSFASASVFLLLVTLLASGIPARRATTIDPVVALRAE